MTRSTSWPENSGAPPVFATTRNTSLHSDGAQVGVIARTLGTPLIPWQQHVADVATEQRPDGSYEYQVVVVSVPRQTGKTTLLHAIATHRALVRGRDVFYTAQTGKDARERWTDLVSTVGKTPALKERHTVFRRGGSEQLVLNDRAAVRVFAPTPDSLHGYTPPAVMIDEAFALAPGQADLLMGAIGPAQLTIVDRQLWIVSTAGTAESTFLHDWIDKAVDGTPRVAGFIWGARDDHDPFNTDDIAAFHPGVGERLNGKVLTAQEVLDQADRGSRAEYERAYANRRTLTTAHLIPPETWRGLRAGDLTPPPTDHVALGYAVAYDRSSATILAAWRPDHAPDTVALKIVEHRPGVAWLGPALEDLDRRWTPQAVTCPDGGPTGSTTEHLRDAGVPVEPLGEREYAAACSDMLTRVDESTLAHDGAELLETAFTGLVTRTAGSDGLAFSLRHSAGNAAPAAAAAAAAWRLSNRDQAPRIYVPGVAS